MCSRHQPADGADSIRVRYCSHPDGHAPKDCPDFQRWYDDGVKADLKENLRNMDIEIDDDELDEKIHDGSLIELL